jgi:hypothetical protein
MDDETKYLIPSGDGNTNIAIDLVEIVKAEQRLVDVAIVNVHTAPEMLATFNSNWLKLNKSVAALTHHKNKADNCYKNAQADAKLECTEEKLAQLGHTKASADLRAAFVQKDPNVQKTKDRLDEISYVLEVLRGKMEAFYNAYSSVKRLVDGKSLPPENYGNVGRPAPFTAPKEKSIPAPAPKEEYVPAHRPTSVPWASLPQPLSLQSQGPDFEPLPPGFRGK